MKLRTRGGELLIMGERERERERERRRRRRRRRRRKVRKRRKRRGEEKSLRLLKSVDSATPRISEG
ncbi:unnamed protein product [Prunus brigantina]